MSKNISLVALLDVEGRILLELRKDNMWGLLGGHTELSDKGRTEAAFRELFEESQFVNIANKRHLFLHDEPRDGDQYFFDVFTGNYYGKKMPVPLVGEGMLDERWFSFKRARRMSLTPIANMAIDALDKNDRSLLPECRHHFQMVINKAKSEGGSEKDMAELKTSLELAEESLSGIVLSPKSKKRGTIVMVDNDFGILETFKETFESQGFVVYTFSNPVEADLWLCASEDEIDALIVDQRMPSMNGDDFIKKIRSCLDPETVIILISAEEVPPEVKEGVLFFKKPVMPDELIRAIT